MKKAFDQNVSRAKPRVRLGGALAELPGPDASLPPPTAEAPELEAAAELAAQVKARAEQSRLPPRAATDSLHEALAGSPLQASVWRETW